MTPSLLLLVGALLAGAPGSKPAPDARESWVEAEVVFDARAGRQLVGRIRALSETTPPDRFRLVERGPDGDKPIASGVGAAAYAPDGAILFVEGDSLIELAGGERRAIARGVAPDFALDPRGLRIAVVRPGEPPGSAIALIGRDGTRIRTLVEAAGWNGLPVFTPDGEAVVFSSTRTGLQSLFRVGVAGGPARQLTNVGLVAPGQPGFVPPIESRRGLAFEGPRALRFGEGRRAWIVDVKTGSARRAEEAR